jgi:hypothetical protein
MRSGQMLLPLSELIYREENDFYDYPRRVLCGLVLEFSRFHGRLARSRLSKMGTTIQYVFRLREGYYRALRRLYSTPNPKISWHRVCRFS